MGQTEADPPARNLDGDQASRVHRPGFFDFV